MGKVAWNDVVTILVFQENTTRTSHLVPEQSTTLLPPYQTDGGVRGIWCLGMGFIPHLGKFAVG